MNHLNFYSYYLNKMNKINWKKEIPSVIFAYVVILIFEIILSEKTVLESFLSITGQFLIVALLWIAYLKYVRKRG